MSTTDHTREAEYWAIHEIVQRGRSWSRVTDLAAENDARAMLAAHVAAVVEGRDTEIAKWQRATFEREGDRTAAESRARIAEHEHDEAVAGLADVRARIVSAYKLGVRDAQQVVAGEDTIEWARNVSQSNASLAWLIEGMDDLIEDDADITARIARTTTDGGVR